jgi:hypothetical protein
MDGLSRAGGNGWNTKQSATTRRQAQNRALKWMDGLSRAGGNGWHATRSDCPALSTGAVVGIVIACVVVVGVVVGVVVWFFVIKPKKAAVAPDQQAPTSGPAKTF